MLLIDFVCSSVRIFLFTTFSVHLHFHLRKFSLRAASFSSIRGDSSFQTEFFLCGVEIMTHFRNHDFFLTVNVQHLKETHHVVVVSRNSQHWTCATDLSHLMMRAAACCSLLKDRDTEGICTYFSLLREHWRGQLSCFSGFCDVRRISGRNVINVCGEAVLLGVYSLVISITYLGP